MPSCKSFEIWVVNKVLSRWQKLWSRQRRKKKKVAPQVQLASAKSASYEEGSVDMPPGRSFKIWAS